MIVTIDGPAGAGKSTVAKRLSEELKFNYLDTGAMYRSMVFAAISTGTDLADPVALLETCRAADIDFRVDEIVYNGENIRDEIRTPEISRQVKFVADHIEIRKLLVEKQRELASTGDFVCEGRDQGTVAFPTAECKIFLTASSSERAKRRVADLQEKGINAEVNEIQKDQDERDERDRQRPVGALQKADDAVEVSTDGLSIDEVVAKLATLVREKQSAAATS